MKLSIIGAGYVGLVAAACFADYGMETIISTQDKGKLKLIQAGKAPFYEPNLNNLLKKAINEGKLTATSSREEAVLNSDITFVCVGTPSKNDGSVDLTHIFDTAHTIGKALNKKKSYHVIVIRSTVIPNTTSKVKEIIESYGNSNFGVCMCPEFLRQGQAVYDTLHPDRIIIGEDDSKAGDTVITLFRLFYNDKVPMLIMSTVSAEMVKYASNAFLATKISFVNEMANICEKVKGLDIKEVTEGMGLDSRIGSQFLDAGAGFGGSCFPKDVKAIVYFSEKLDYYPYILGIVLETNKMQAIHVAELVWEQFPNLNKKKIAILGLSFKPDTDDTREAPATRIIQWLNMKEKPTISTYDPVVKSRTASSVKECLKDADCCILVTEWDEFRKMKPKDFKGMKGKLIIDARRIWNPQDFRDAGFTYKGIGLGEAK